MHAAAQATARADADLDRRVQSARPVGAVTHWRDPLTRTGRALWTREAGLVCARRV
jgi:hypothetical protein